MLVCSSHARAQNGYPGSAHYAVTYSGGTSSSSGGPSLPLVGRPNISYTGGANGTAYGRGDVAYGPPGYGASVTCSGQITATLTWTPTAAGELPPAAVIVEEDGTANYSTYGPARGSCNDGVGDASPMGGTYASLSGTKYIAQVNPGTTFSVTCTPTATSSGPADPNGTQASAGVSFKATPFPMNLQGHSTVDTANWDPTHPRFFSGTNCSVSGTAQAYSAPPGNATYPAGGSYVTQATLSLGGTVVKYYYDANFVGPTQPGAAIGTNQASVPLSVVFDSTYFAEGSSILAQLTVTDSGGFTYTVSLSAPSYNNLLAVANQTYSWIDYHINPSKNVAESAVDGNTSNGQPYPGVMTQSSPNNISGNKKDDAHKNDLITQISYSDRTVFFAATHTDPGSLGDCYSLADTDPAYDPAAYLHDNDIQGAIATRTAALSAPFLFVYLHGCDGGDDTALANDFGFSTISADDRAFVGYTIRIAVNQRNTNFAVTMWHFLMQGEGVQQAENDAFQKYKVQRYIDQNTAPNDNPGNTQHAVVYGDYDMTLHGNVYKWVSGPTWYR